jgi:ABC-type multidrug transport system permease subunit
VYQGSITMAIATTTHATTTAPQVSRPPEGSTFRAFTTLSRRRFALSAHTPREILVPLSCILGGIGMIVDRDSGAQRDLLAAPIPRSLMVLGNMSVAVTISALQVVVLLVAAVLRGATLATAASGIAWTVSATLALAVAMHSVAEILAARIAKQEEYVGVAPPVALLPWFFAGSFFPSIRCPPA